jgi:hypothetical protein
VIPIRTSVAQCELRSVRLPHRIIARIVARQGR